MLGSNIMDKLTIINYPLYNLFGYMLQRKLPRPSAVFAKKYFEHIKDLVICEVGVLEGENANSLIKYLKPKEIYLIEPFTEPKIKGDHVLIKKKSIEASKDIPLCDYIYLDGDHRYKTISEELPVYWKKIKRGGILAGHDFSSAVPGVIKAVTEFVIKNNLKLNVTHFDWWIIKNGS